MRIPRTIVALVIVLSTGCHGWPFGKTPPATTPTVTPHRFGVGTVVTSPRSRWSDYENLGVDASGSIKASPGVVSSLYCQNLNAAVRYVQLFDSSSAPIGGATPRFEWGVPAGGGEIIVGDDFFQVDGLGFNAGIAWGVSTTKGTFTAATAADHDVIVTFR